MTGLQPGIRTMTLRCLQPAGFLPRRRLPCRSRRAPHRAAASGRAPRQAAGRRWAQGRLAPSLDRRGSRRRNQHHAAPLRRCPGRAGHRAGQRAGPRPGLEHPAVARRQNGLPGRMPAGAKTLSPGRGRRRRPHLPLQSRMPLLPVAGPRRRCALRRPGGVPDHKVQGSAGLPTDGLLQHRGGLCRCSKRPCPANRCRNQVPPRCQARLWRPLRVPAMPALQRSSPRRQQCWQHCP